VGLRTLERWLGGRAPEGANGRSVRVWCSERALFCYAAAGRPAGFPRKIQAAQEPVLGRVCAGVRGVRAARHGTALRPATRSDAPRVRSLAPGPEPIPTPENTQELDGTGRARLAWGLTPTVTPTWTKFRSDGRARRRPVALGFWRCYAGFVDNSVRCRGRPPPFEPP
jgi:hypothetical protein